MAGGFTVHQRKSLSAPITKIYAGRFSAAGGSWRSMYTLGGIGTSVLSTSRPHNSEVVRASSIYLNSSTNGEALGTNAAADISDSQSPRLYQPPCSAHPHPSPMAPTPESAAFLAKKPTVPASFDGVDYDDTPRLKQAQDAIIREQWVRSMMARLVREEMGKCYYREGVNHLEKCGALRGEDTRSLVPLPFVFVVIRSGCWYEKRKLIEHGRAIFRAAQRVQGPRLLVRAAKLHSREIDGDEDKSSTGMPGVMTYQ